MFNSPILDVAIGLVFIFLLYSLLATSIKEALATLLGLRADMLKKGISEGMLSDTPADLKWLSIGKGVLGFFKGILDKLGFWPKMAEEEKNIGDKFFDHPLIKNYGSNRLYPLPSYIKPENFSDVLIDVLKADFNKKKELISQSLPITPTNKDANSILQSLESSSDAVKIKELLQYYLNIYKQTSNPPKGFIIGNETCQVLQMLLEKSVYNIDQFAKQLESWFNDTMDRVSGWYKRQVQLILFIIGFILAIIFNVDIIEIATKLSKDKDARGKMIELAVKASDKYKDDPRVQRAFAKPGTPTAADTAKADALFDAYQKQVKSAQSLIQSDIDSANNILALGWGNFGAKKSFWGRFGFTLSSSFTSGRKILGFLILAFAVCLGAPFWFDLLNKFINLRAAGKKIDDGDSSDKGKSNSQQPVTVNVNTQNSGQEAAG